MNRSLFLFLCRLFFVFVLIQVRVALSAQIHYFVLKEDAAGTLSVEGHQVIDANEKLDESNSDRFQPSRHKSRIDIFVENKVTGSTVYKTYAYSSLWLRGEFHGENEIDGRDFPKNEKFYVVRVPSERGTFLRASSSVRAEEVSRNPENSPSKPR